jgi:hypothetical protein
MAMPVRMGPYPLMPSLPLLSLLSQELTNSCTHTPVQTQQHGCFQHFDPQA